jgi:hypothetical protein
MLAQLCATQLPCIKTKSLFIAYHKIISHLGVIVYFLALPVGRKGAKVSREKKNKHVIYEIASSLKKLLAMT